MRSANIEKGTGHDPHKSLQSTPRTRTVATAKARRDNHRMEMAAAGLTAVVTIALVAWIVTILGASATHVAFMLPY